MAGLIWAHASLWGFLINLPYQGIRWNWTSNCKQETPDNEFILLPVEKSLSFASILIFLNFWFFFLYYHVQEISNKWIFMEERNTRNVFMINR